MSESSNSFCNGVEGDEEEVSGSEGPRGRSAGHCSPSCEAVEEAVVSFEQKVAALEAKVSEIGATPSIKTYNVLP